MWIDGKLRRWNELEEKWDGEQGNGNVEEGRKGGGEGSGRYKIAFWNVAGVRKKDGDFWKGMEDWDIIVLSETWVEEKDWGYVETRLARGYIWKRQWAKRESVKGRAMGGMIMRVRKGLEMEEEVEKRKELW